MIPMIPLPPVISGSVHLRVRYNECDPMRVAHHGAYPAWLELGRTELLRNLGKSYAAMEQEGVFFVVTALDIRYRRPIVYDDVVDVRTRVTEASRVRLCHAYEIHVLERNQGGPELPRGAATVAQTTLACVGRDGKVREIPAWLGPIDHSAPARPG